MQDICKNIKEYNLGKKHKIVIVFDYMIADMINNKKLNPVVTELFIRDQFKFKLVFINLKFQLFLLCNHILKYHKMLD